MGDTVDLRVEAMLLRDVANLVANSTDANVRTAAVVATNVAERLESLAAPGSPPPTPAPTPEAVAQAFHEAYERLAPSFGYETRKASAVPWPEVPENNRRLMTAVAGEVLALIAGAPTPAPTREQVRRELVVARARTPHDVEAQTDAVMALLRPEVTGG